MDADAEGSTIALRERCSGELTRMSIALTAQHVPPSCLK